MKKIAFLLTIGMLLSQWSSAQEIIPLYDSKIPGSKVTPVEYKEESVVGEDGVLRVSQVSVPTLTIYSPPAGKSNGTAVIICPGGGYRLLAFEREGTKVAQQFADMGVTAFVLKYRLPSDQIMEDKTVGPLQDALQAIYLIRKNAKVWNINPNKIGVMGFSAGGHLASSLSVHYKDQKVHNQENISLRPDFSILIYPVISFGTISHAGSVNRLLGDQPTGLQKAYFSSQNHVDAETPPAFLVHANDDTVVPVRNSTIYNESLLKFKVPSEMHIYQSGGHGFGLFNKTTKENWFLTMTHWMEANKFLPQ